ncbi:MAG: germination protein YpeB [Thermoanaerobacteraceae bacterium]|nr:germination protein YpeB [Thermoanaerobacteraceae bacterium]
MEIRKKHWLWMLAAGVVLEEGCSGVLGHQQYSLRQRLETALNNKYYRAFYSLVENVQHIEVLLSKSLVAAGAEQDSRLFTELWQRANAAQADLNQLPLADVQTARTAKFLTQVGDYAYSLQRQTAGGQNKSAAQWETLKNLYRQSADLNLELHNIEARIARGRLYLSELARESGRGVQKEGPRLADGNFSTIEKHMEAFPTLIYDGPFSDHLEKSEPRGLTGKVINMDEAGQRARQMVDGGSGYTLGRVTEARGKIPSYLVELRPASGTGEVYTVAVTRQGGHLNWMAGSRPAGNPTWDINRAREKARQYLAALGYRDMAPVYYEQQGGVAIFNFAAVQDRVILYPDQVKVTVALDNGQVLGVEASGYLMNHHQRQLPRPRISAAQARRKISPRLGKVTGGRLALIPVAPDKEKLTYEFQGRLDKDTFLIYINALDGKEEQVLRVVRSPEGILTL